MEGEQELGSSSKKKQEPDMSFAEWADYMCPYYMALGVSYAEYWHGDPTVLPYYAEAHELRNAQRNHEMWMQGLYIHDAVSIAIHNAFKKKSDKAISYNKEPYPLTQLEAEKRKERDRLNALQTAKAQFEAWSETTDFNEGGETNGDND